jgi:hypothetical protein
MPTSDAGNEGGSHASGVRLQFHYPFTTDAGAPDDGFVGIWAPRTGRLPGISLAPGPPADEATVLQGPNWLLAAPRTSYRDGAGDKVHVDARSGAALAFRGYVLDPALHHFSPPERLFAFWQQRSLPRINGVFATAVIDAAADKLTLITDAFGFGPLYYRVAHDAVWFGSRADLLRTGREDLDTVSALCVISHGFAPGNRSLYAGIERVPAGSCLHFERSTVARLERWFDPASLPTAERPLRTGDLVAIEAALDQSVDRCLALDYAPRVSLPLSSGNDSRRLLGALRKTGCRIDALTVRVFQQGHRDLDATFAAVLAGHVGIDHHVIDQPHGRDLIRDDAQRRRRTGAETPMHTWAMALMRALPATPSVLFDGVLGDVLGAPVGYGFPGQYADGDADLATIASLCADIPGRRYLAPEMLQGEALREVIAQAIAPFGGRRNASEFAFLALRQRRATALWSQQNVPPAHLVVCPFLDLDYIDLVTRFRPEDRLAQPLQAACLERFHPDLHRIPGSRRIPQNMRASGRLRSAWREHARLGGVIRGTDARTQRACLWPRLSPEGRMLAALARIDTLPLRRWHWIILPLFEVLMHAHEQALPWELLDVRTMGPESSGDYTTPDMPRSHTAT